MKDPTSELLQQMLKEKTLIHFLDSGFAYGYHWQKNQQIDDFSKTPPVIVTEDGVMLNIYHYLYQYLDRDQKSEELEKDFYSFVYRAENDNKTYLEIFREWIERNGYELMCLDNTYNFDNLISQVFIFGIFKIDEDSDDDYIFLMIHNGCDVRGGYTDPRFFRLVDTDEFLMNMNEAWAVCECGAFDVNSGENEYEWTGDSWRCTKCGSRVEFVPPWE